MTTTEFGPEHVLSVLRLQQLIADYCHALDRDCGIDAPEYFTDDGVLDVGRLRYAGRPAMQRFYLDLAEQVRTSEVNGVRTTRHVCSNLRIELESSDRATVHCVMTNYSGPGGPPILNGTVPSVVSDARFDCVYVAQHGWRIARLCGEPIFVGGDPLQNKVLVG